MAARDAMNKYLFATQFEMLHGLSVDDALSGEKLKMTVGNDTHFLTPEEYENFWPKTSKLHKPGFATEWRQRHAENMARPRDTGEIIRKIQGNYGTTEFLVGDVHSRAADLRDLTTLMRTQSRPNEKPLYRGAYLPPKEDIREGKDRPLSYSEDRRVAEVFATPTPSGRRAVFEAAPNQVRGLPLKEFGGIKRTVGKNNLDEREWLVDPQSIKQ